MTPHPTRRRFFGEIAGSALAVTAAGTASRVAMGAPAVVGLSNTDVKNVERTVVRLKYKPIPAKYYTPYREGHAGTVKEIYRVTLANGVRGFGEGAANPAALKRVVGRPVADSMWDDSIGGGLQIALFDALGRTLGVPMHRLFGRQVRDRAFLSWWAGGMRGPDWVSECKEALSLGFTAFKGKARPWYDLNEQCRQLSAVLPPHFSIDFDFNATLLDTSRAARYLIGLEKYSQIAVWETPIPQEDVAGNRFLRTQTRVPIAMHFGSPPIMTALREDVCDVFVVGGGVRGTLDTGALAATAGKSFWLQLGSTGIVAAYSMQLAAVLSHARWPAVTQFHLYTEQLVKPGITVLNGSAAIPDSPGLGFDLDEDAVARHRLDIPASQAAPSGSSANRVVDYGWQGRSPDGPLPTTRNLMVIRWPNGARSYYAAEERYKQEFLAGRLPPFQPGVYVEEVPDDGSRDWRELQARAEKGGVHMGALPR